MPHVLTRFRPWLRHPFRQQLHRARFLFMGEPAGNLLRRPVMIRHIERREPRFYIRRHRPGCSRDIQRPAIPLHIRNLPEPRSTREMLKPGARSQRSTPLFIYYMLLNPEPVPRPPGHGYRGYADRYAYRTPYPSSAGHDRVIKQSDRLACRFDK